MQILKPINARYASASAVSRPSVLCSSRASTVKASASKQVYCFDIDTILSGLEPLYCHVGQECWQHVAATSAAAGQDCLVPGSHALYHKTMRQLLPVVQQPAYEAALLMRLLAEEGVVGAEFERQPGRLLVALTITAMAGSRSVGGRAGPVVGRPVRHSGSRPLLVQEILEHWSSEIQPTCLLRWSRQAGLTPEDMTQQLQQAYQQVLATLEWQVVDAAGVCHGSSSSSGGNSSSSSTTLGLSGSSSSSSSSRVNRQAPDSTTATAAAPAAAATRSSFHRSNGFSLVVQPYTSVVQAILSCQQSTVVASPYPQAVTQAALAAAGLCSQQGLIVGGGAVSIVQGLSLAQCAQELVEQQQQQHLATTFMLSSPSKARLVQQHIAQCQDVMQQPYLEAAHSQGSTQQQQQQQQQQQVVLQVGEWACAAPSLRAKALASPQLGLLSEVALAEMLGVSSSDAVMDCIAWRG